MPRSEIKTSREQDIPYPLDFSIILPERRELHIRGRAHKSHMLTATQSFALRKWAIVSAYEYSISAVD